MSVDYLEGKTEVDGQPDQEPCSQHLLQGFQVPLASTLGKDKDGFHVRVQEVKRSSNLI